MKSQSGAMWSVPCSAAMIMLAFAIPIAGHPAPARLSGCQDPTAIAAAIAKLRAINWQNVSATRLSEVWPRQLTPVDCNGGECKSTSSEDRIIAGVCACCEIFYFDKEAGSAQPKQLNNIVIHYSASTRREAIEAGRRFARGAGFAEADVAMIGQMSQQHFEWDSRDEGIYFSVEIHLTQRRNLWDLYFNLGTGALTR